MSNVCTQGQPFAKNYNPSYSQAGLIGHTGEDWSCGHGSPILSKYDGYVYKVLSPLRPANDGSGFTGVFMIVDDGQECFEWLVGHCDPLVQEGQWVKKGEIIGREGNHGKVFSGNVEITLEMQRAGDTRGAHRHYQKRPLIISKTYGDEALSGRGRFGFHQDKDGNFYQIPNWRNGFNGCVPPGEPVFGRDLFVGRSGYDVWVLQRCLKRMSFFKAECTGYFGPVTLAAVAAWQRANGVFPTLGYFGAVSRARAGMWFPAPAPSLGDE